MEEAKAENTSNSTEVETKEDEETAEFNHPLHGVGNAERFVKQHSDYLKFCSEWKAWLFYTAGQWEIQQSKTRLYQMAKETIQNMRDEAEREDLSYEQKQALLGYADKSSKKSSINAMLDLASMEPKIQVSAKHFNSNLIAIFGK